MPEQVELAIVVTVDEALAELVTDRMWQWGVRAVSETSLGDGQVELVTSVGSEPSAVDRAIATLDADWPREIREIDTALAQVDPAFLTPTWYSPGKVVVPAPIHPVDVDEAVTLVTVIDPGAAFGLGDHPTTCTSMAMLAAHVEQAGAVPERVLDVGCGTGALAVLAAQLDVPTIRAIDIADAAVESTLRNAELNDVIGRIDVDTTPLAQLTGSYDLIMANILAPVLVSMADDLKRLLAPGGALVISGILARRHDHVLAALSPLEPVESMEMDGWITIKLK